MSRLIQKLILYRNYREDGLYENLLPLVLFNEKIRQRGAQAVLPTLLTHPKLSSKHRVHANFGHRFVGKEDGLLTYKPSYQELGQFCIKRLTIWTSD